MKTNLQTANADKVPSFTSFHFQIHDGTSFGQTTLRIEVEYCLQMKNSFRNSLMLLDSKKIK